MNDSISRQAAIDELWKNLYEYEDKTEKKFQESEDLDVGDWIEHRIFVQNMNDMDRQTILNLPSVQPEIIRCKDCENWDTTWQNDWDKNYHYCPLIDGIRNGDWYCADAERRTDE